MPTMMIMYNVQLDLKAKQNLYSCNICSEQIVYISALARVFVSNIHIIISITTNMLSLNNFELPAFTILTQ